MADPDHRSGSAPLTRAQLAVLAIIRGYQVTLAPFLGGACRFEPSCSQYAAQAVAEWGAARGSWLAVRRLSRCHPFGPHGIDPVPAGRDRA